MAPVKKPLSFWRGNTEALRFRFKQNATDPLDLTGSRFVLTIKHDGPDIVKDSDASGWDISTPTNGEATVSLSATETRSLSGAIAGVRYEIERFIGEEQKTLIYGDITIAGGIGTDV